MDGVFAGGDCVTGPATAIRAIAAGKVAAANIDEYLGFHHEITVEVDDPRTAAEQTPRPTAASTPPSGRPPSARTTLTASSAASPGREPAPEASRCLRCDHFGYGIFKGGRNGKW